MEPLFLFRSPYLETIYLTPKERNNKFETNKSSRSKERKIMKRVRRARARKKSFKRTRIKNKVTIDITSNLST